MCKAAALVFVFSLGLYILTLSPTISVGDSPELISSAFTLGIGHPPGYPLFSLLGKSVTFFPFVDSIAYKINLLSAFWGGISVVFIYLSILEATRLIRKNQGSLLDNLSAFFGGITFAVSPIFWSQAVVAEVYTLNAAFFTLLLWLGLKWTGYQGTKMQGYGPRLLYIISFLWGLSLGNHHTMIAFGPIFLIFAGIYSLKGRGSESSPSPYSLPLVTVFFLLGLSVYLYLPIRSVRNPFMDWGDTEKVSGFLEVILRKQFGLGSRDYSLGRAMLQGDYYFSLLREQFTIIGLILGTAGAALFFKRCIRPFLFTLGLFLVHGILTVLILNPSPQGLYSQDVMIIPSLAVFSIWIGGGFLFVYSGVAAIFMRGLTEAKEWVIGIVLTLILLLIPVAVMYANFAKNDQRGNTFARDYAEDVFKSIEQNGVLFVDTDLSLFPLWYMQYVEGARRDVAVLNVDMLMLPWFKGQLKEKYPNIEIRVPDVVRHAKGGRFKPLSMEALESYKVSQTEEMLDGLMKEHPVYLSYEFGVPFKEFGERKDIGLSIKGVVFKASREKMPDEPIGDFLALRSILKAVSSRGEDVLFIARAYVPAMERAASKELSSGRRNRSMEFMEGILTVDPDNTDSLNNLAYMYAEDGKNFLEAERMVKRAMALNPREQARYMKTLGFVYLKKGEYGRAIGLFKEVLTMEPGSNWTLIRLREAEKGGGK